jgi:hypothetical protein
MNRAPDTNAAARVRLLAAMLALAAGATAIIAIVLLHAAVP